MTPEEYNKHLYEYRHNPAVVAIMEYLHIEMATAYADATEALRAGQQLLSNACLGGADALMQVITKLDKLRNQPPPVEFEPEVDEALG